MNHQACIKDIDFPKIMNVKDSIIRSDRMMEARGLFRSAMCNVFPLHPESPYGAKKQKLTENQVFQFFGLLNPYWAP